MDSLKHWIILSKNTVHSTGLCYEQKKKGKNINFCLLQPQKHRVCTKQSCECLLIDTLLYFQEEYLTTRQLAWSYITLALKNIFFWISCSFLTVLCT